MADASAKSGKKVLYISYDGLTDQLGQSQILPYVKELSRTGYRFTILTCDKPNRYQTLSETIKRSCSEDNIKWESIPFREKPPVISKICDRVQLSKRAFKLFKKERFDIIHCRGYVSAEIGLKLKRKYGCKFLFDMRGFWADEKIDGGNWNMRNPLFKCIYRFYKAKEKQFLEEADSVVCLTTAAKKEMLSWKHICRNTLEITVIPCCVDTELFDISKITESGMQLLRDELQVSAADFVISYLGSIGTWYMFNEMLDFFVQLKHKLPSAKFLFITQDKHDRVRASAKEKGIKQRDIIIRSASRAQVPELLAISNWSVFFIRPSYSKMSSSPTKQGEVMSMGIPVICNAGVGDTDAIVDLYHAGVVMYDFDFQKALEEMLQAKPDPVQIRNGAKEYFDLKQGAKRYAEIYNSIAGNS